MTTVVNREFTAWQQAVTTSVKSAGTGSPVIFFHGAAGLQWDPLLDALAEAHTVHAPLFPGTDGVHHGAIKSIDSWYDLVVYYAELLDALGVGRVALVGHSFGGMVASEFAATYPERVEKLVLIDPIGLWRDDAPVTNWMALPPDALMKATFADPTGPVATLTLSMMADLGNNVDALAKQIWSLGCTGKFVWPIPDRGLVKRIHRIAAPTLVVWGKQDGIVPVAYAEEFGRHIKSARVEVIDGAGHLPQLERPDEVIPLVRSFLGE